MIVKNIKVEIKMMFFELLSFLNKIVPKKQRVFIYGGGRLYDNNEAMFDYLLNYTVVSVVCVAKKHRYFKLRDKVAIVNNDFFTVLYYYLTSKVIIASFFHSIRFKPANNQFSIQMWHGSAVKRFDLHDEYRNGQYYSVIFCASPFFSKMYRKAFGITDDKLVFLGNPRNDYLFVPTTGSIKTASKNIIWMPTYRQGLGRDDSSNIIPVINKNNISIIDDLLKGLDMMLFIKPHPMQSKKLDILLSGIDNIKVLTDDQLRDANIPLYSFLGAMDALLTDYSSVFFDYLLLDRKIGFVIDDIDEYSQKRGFAFENLFELMPGDKIYNINELLTFIKNLNIDNEDAYKEKRREILELTNSNLGQDNCKKCYDLIKMHL